MTAHLTGPRHVIDIDDEGYPEQLRECKNPPKRIFMIGNPGALSAGLAIVGARKATPYGISHAEHFAAIAASRGIAIISGGALGCDSAAHRGALSAGAKTVAVLGGGCDRVYPAKNRALFQEIIDSGGAVISENPWDDEPLGWRFRARNRIIAGLASATLIVEAGLPSGTFSTADEALAAGREVLALPGAITSKQSLGSNQLIFQGAVPVIDDESFHGMLDAIFPLSASSDPDDACATAEGRFEEASPVLEAIQAQPLSVDEIRDVMSKDGKGGQASVSEVMMMLAILESQGRIAKYPDGRYGPKHANGR